MPLSVSRSELGSVLIQDIKLEFKEKDGGGRHYRGRSHYEESTSPFYPLLECALRPQHCIDVGANYGFTGILMRRAFPACKLTLVEPIPWLAEFVEHNFQINSLAFDKFHSAAVGAKAGQTQFGVNTNATQDSRVVPKAGWNVIETNMITVSDLAYDFPNEQGVYIKVDTQGWEEGVFNGAEEFLERHHRWFIKTEFAPMWLESQGSDPVSVLRWLLHRYRVYEHAGRFCWNCASLAQGLGMPISLGSAEAFVKYVRGLNAKGSGWVDLFIVPNEVNIGYDLRPPLQL
jgi:FkbM family methyltransferase